MRAAEEKTDRGSMMRKTFSVVLVAVALAGSFGVAVAEAQTDNAAHERLLTVNGEGTVTGAPDLALITLGVVSEAPAARDALAQNSQSMNRILTALKEGGIEGRDLQTSGFSVDPVYSQPPPDYDNAQPFRPQIVGYSVRNNLTLRIRALAKVGELLDQVVTLGANSISGPTFTVDDPTTLQDKARGEAVTDALRKAKLYASAAGIALGPIFHIEEGYTQPPQPLAAGAMMRMEAAPSSVPIEGGELTFQAHVAVSWRIAD
jgi:uncharacterized protein YggE